MSKLPELAREYALHRGQKGIYETYFFREQTRNLLWDK